MTKSKGLKLNARRKDREENLTFQKIVPPQYVSLDLRACVNLWFELSLALIFDLKIKRLMVRTPRRPSATTNKDLLFCVKRLQPFCFRLSRQRQSFWQADMQKNLLRI